MADQKITEMPAATSVSDTDVFPVVQSGTNKKATMLVLKTFMDIPPPGSTAWGDITGTLSAQTDLQTALDGKVDENTPVTPATKTKITFDADGLVTVGADATTADINDSTNRRYVTDAQLTVIGNTSGTNTGDQQLFKTIAVSGQSDVVADAAADTLTLAAGSNITPTTNPGTDTVTIAAAAGASGTVTTTGLPATGNLTKFSGATSITNGDLSGDVTTSGALAATIANDAVTYAKMQNVSAISKLLGRGDSGAPGDPQEITLGTNLSMSGTTLNASAGGGGVTNIATTSPITGGPITTTGTIDLVHSVDLAMTAAQSVTVNNASTNTTDNLLTISHNSTGAVASGFGSAILFKLETNTTADTDAGSISVGWSTVAHGSRRSFMDFKVANGFAPDIGMRLWQQGAGNSASLTVGNNTDPGSNGIIVANAGYRYSTATPSTGKILQSNGNAYVDSTITWPASAGTAGYTVRSDGSNFASYPQDVLNSSVASQSPSTSDVYVAGSNVVVAAGDFKAKGQYRCLFDVTKSAGTGGIVISVRTGTAGTTSDTANLTFTFPAGTSVADVGTFEVLVNWRTVGSGTSAVVAGLCRAQKNTITAAGLWNDTSAAKTIVATVSSGFASNTFTNMGVSFNGGTAFAGTITTVQASLLQ